jgi:hypothetical protein
VRSAYVATPSSPGFVSVAGASTKRKPSGAAGSATLRKTRSPRHDEIRTSVAVQVGDGDATRGDAAEAEAVGRLVECGRSGNEERGEDREEHARNVRRATAGSGPASAEHAEAGERIVTVRCGRR